MHGKKTCFYGPKEKSGEHIGFGLSVSPSVRSKKIQARVLKGGRALSPFFGPLRKQKYESYCTTISSRCFIS